MQDEIYELARRNFNEKELVDLTTAIVAIKRWNRFSFSFRREAGTYQPQAQARNIGAKRSAANPLSTQRFLCVWR